DPDNCIFCEDILDGSGQAESQDIDGDGYCDRFEGCTDPTACNYKLTAEDDIDPITLENKNDYQFPNNPHLNNPDAVNGCIYVDYTSTPCGFCSPSENGFGFVINGDIDEDGLCDVFDSDRRIPLRMVYHAGGLGGDSVVFTGPYSNLAFIPFDMAREEYGARTTYSRFSNLQFGQPFDITIQDAGTFDKTFMGMMGGSGNTAASADAISTNAYAPTSVEDVIQSSSEVLSDSWSKFSADDVGFTRTTTEGFTPAMQGEFQALSVDDSGVIILSNLAYDHSDLTDESNYSNISLKVAATGTDAHYGSSSLTPCVDTTGYSFWSTQLPSSTVRPAFCQEFNTLNTQLGTITANLSRAESTTAHPVFRSATFISGNDNNRDYYTLNAKANGQKLTWQEAHDYDYDLFTGGTLSSGAAELSALSDGEINDISLLNNSDEAWLDASLSVTAGIVASDNASNGLLWKWKNTTVENAFPTGHVQSPLLGIDSKGPGTTSNFPLLNGSSSRNGVAYEDLRINNGRAYVRSTSRQNFSKFNAESTFGFIASTSSEQTWVKDYVPGADRIWNYITRNTAGTWSCKTTGESTFYQDWVAGTPPTGHVNGVFKFHNIDYCQLVSDLNSYPKIVSGASNGRQKVTIPSSSIKMVPVGRDGRLYDIHIVGNIFGRWQETGYYLFNRRTLGANQDVSFKYELPSFSAASGGSQPSNAAFEDLDVMGTVYFFLWTADKHTYSWYYNKLREWGVSPGTFGNNSSMEQYVVGDYDWTWGDMWSGMRTQYASEGSAIQLNMDGSGARTNTYTRWNGGEPNNKGQEINIEYWRKGGTSFRWNNEWSSRENHGMVGESSILGGLSQATMVLETVAPADNQWHLVAQSTQFKALEETGSNRRKALFDKPTERLVNPATVTSSLTGTTIDWTPLYETEDNWYYFSNTNMTFAQAERAAAIVGGGLFCNRDAEPGILNTLGSLIPAACWVGLEQQPVNGAYAEPGGGWQWHNNGSGTPSWDPNTPGYPNDAGGNANYGLLQLNGYLVDKPNGAQHKALIQISKEAKAEVAATLTATVDSENGATYLELNPVNGESSDSEPIADLNNSIEGTQMKYAQVTIDASASSNQADLFLEYNAGTADSILMILYQGIPLNAGQNTIRFYESFTEDPNNATVLANLGVDAVYILADDNDFSTHFGTKESLVDWRLHIVDRTPTITHAMQDFKIRFEKSAILNINAVDSLQMNPAHGVYLTDIAVTLSNDTNPSFDPRTLAYELTAPQKPGAVEANIYPFSFDAFSSLTEALATNGELLNGEWTLSVANPDACEDCAVVQFGLTMITPPAIKTGPVRVNTGDFLLQQVQVAGSSAPIATTPHVDIESFEDDIITTLIPDNAGNDPSLTEVQVSYHHTAALLPDHPDLISITQEITTDNSIYNLIQSVDGRLIYLSETPMTFEQAQQDAFLNGGKLITLTDSDLLDTLSSMNCHGWLGHKTTEPNLTDWAPILAAPSMQWSGFGSAISNPASAGRFVYLNEAGALVRTDGTASIHGLFELPTIGTPALRITPMTEDNLLFNIYDLADDKAYVGALLGDRNDDTSLEGLQGYLRKYGKTSDLMRFAHETQTGPDIGALNDVPSGWSQIGPAPDSVGYFVSSALFSSWEAANQAAKLAGGRLATAETQAEIDILANSGSDVYFGLRRHPQSGPWTWVTGAALDLDGLSPWASTATPDDATTPYAVAGSTGWRNVSGSGAFRAVMEKTYSPDLTGTDVYMVPTSSDVIGIRYSSDGAHSIPTVALLEQSHFATLRDNTPYPTPGWTALSSTSQSVANWNVPLLIAPDPTQGDDLM
ncbi:MAG: C-type lectin domain-containing protein, partial [Flavobacteriales bacterium]